MSWWLYGVRSAAVESKIFGIVCFERFGIGQTINKCNNLFIFLGLVGKAKVLETSKKRLILKGIIIIIFAFSFSLSFENYPGSKYIYLLFTLASLVLLVSSLFYSRTYSYSLLSIIILLGFWAKVSWYFISAQSFVEPIGAFNGSPEQWDQALLVSVSAFLAILGSLLLVSLVSMFTAGAHINSLRMPSAYRVPSWLKSISLLHWIIFIFSVGLIVYLNITYKIFVIGIKTATVLPWYWNAVITLMLVGGGFSSWMATLIYLNNKNGHQIYAVLFMVILISFFISAFTLSKAIIVNFLLPIGVCFLLNYKSFRIAISKGLAMGALAFLFIFLNVLVVNTLRPYYTQSPDKDIKIEEFASAASSAVTSGSPFDSAKQFFGYSLNRWVGIEGVMATVAHDGKSIDLLVEGVFEEPVKSVAPMYSEIGKWSHTHNEVGSKVDSMYLVGGVGFLNYSGSFYVIFFFTLLIALVIQLFELLVYRLTSNPFLCATIGWMASLAFVHSAGAPLSEIPRIQFIIIAVSLIAIVQSHWLNNIIRVMKDSLYKS